VRGELQMERQEKMKRRIGKAQLWYRFLSVLLAWGMIIWMLSPSLCVSAPSSTINTLIVTGQNTHDWKTSSSALKQMLEDTGLFEVDLAISPAQGEDMGAFLPDFASYQLVVLDYSGEEWSEDAENAFVSYVRSGGGVAVYHGANNTFSRWKEYNQIIGIGGWDGWDETSGPYVYWKDGEIVKDKSSGISGHHTTPHAFMVINQDKTHPITRGLPEKWMHAEDELYGLLRGPAENLHVLATAYSDPAQLGTGRDEPMLFTIQFGKGRIFHTVLGHAGAEAPPTALECVGFIVTFQRGAEWAATGEVKQEIPGFFPAIYRDYGAPDDVRLWRNYRPPDLKKILENVSTYDYGKNEEVLSELRDYVRAVRTTPDVRKKCEKQLAEFLESDATLASKMAVCRHLREIGTSVSVPVLSKMLFQEETSDLARYALEKISDVSAEQALIQGLGRTSGKITLGIMASLGNRRSEMAVPYLKEFLYGADEAEAVASAKALGQIAHSKAADVLSRALAYTSGQLQVQVASSLLSCADEHLANKNSDGAVEIFEALMQAKFPLHIRQAAFKGRISAPGSEAKGTIIHTLKGKDAVWHAPAIAVVRDVFDESEIQEVYAVLSGLPPESQVQLLEVLSLYRVKASLESAVQATKNENGDVRIAALHALESIGDATTVELLAHHAAKSRGREQEGARTSLWSLKGEGVDQAILMSLAKEADPDVQNELIMCVGERRISEGLHWLLAKARCPDARIRQQAIKALKNVASPSDLPLLVKFLTAVEEERDQMEMASTIAAVVQKGPQLTGRARPVMDGLPEVSDIPSRRALYRTLGKIGEDSSLTILRSALNEENLDIQDAVVRALADWPTTTAQEDLLRIARTSTNAVHKILSLQSYIRMVEIDRYRLPERAVKSLQDVLDISRPEEKKLILGILPTFASKEALSLAESLLQEKAVEAEAKMAIEKIKEKLHKN
jgi:type 1 glutamine amidotransferase/HEAT repeat protein